MENPILTGSDYLALPRAEQTWILDPILPTGGSLLLYGNAKVGKSFAALQLCDALVNGTEWLGFHVPQGHKVVYIQLDTPRAVWADRIDGLIAAGYHGLKEVFYADLETLNTWPFDILKPDHKSLLTASLSMIGPNLVVLDTIREAHSAEENDSTAMQQVIAHLTAAVKPAALCLVSHSRKSNPQYGYDLMNDNRGSNYIVGKMDGIIRFTEKTIRISGRSVDEHSINLDRRQDGTWEIPPNDPFKLYAEDFYKAHQGIPIREQARLLHSLTNRSEAACRSWLRRRATKPLDPGRLTTPTH